MKKREMSFARRWTLLLSMPKPYITGLHWKVMKAIRRHRETCSNATSDCVLIRRRHLTSSAMYWKRNTENPRRSRLGGRLSHSIRKIPGRSIPLHAR